MIVVSRESKATEDGRKLCSCGCGQPRDREGQRYRRACHAAYMRKWRQGKVEVLLTHEEWAAILAIRARLDTVPAS
jgi:hypothetical protein